MTERRRTPRPAARSTFAAQTDMGATVMLNGRPVLRGAGVDFAPTDDLVNLPDALTRAELSGSFESTPDDAEKSRAFVAEVFAWRDAIESRKPQEYVAPSSPSERRARVSIRPVVLTLAGRLRVEHDRRKQSLSLAVGDRLIPRITLRSQRDDARPCRACGFGACLFLCVDCAGGLSDPARRPRVLDRLRARLVKERTDPLPLP